MRLIDNSYTTIKLNDSFLYICHLIFLMAETDFQKQVLNTLTEMKGSIETLQKDITYLTEFIEDTKLTEKEKRELEDSISKIKSGNTSDFIPWKAAKKELGI